MAGTKITTTGILYINGTQVENTFTNISKITKKLESELKKLPVDTEAWRKKAEELKTARARFAEVKEEIAAVSGELKKSEGFLSNFKSIFAGNIAADFFSNALGTVQEFGRELIQRVEELNNIKTSLTQLDSSLKGAALDKAASSVKAIADTYGKGVEEIQLAVKGLNAQTKDTNKSLDLIKKGFMSGADASGEMLTQLKEYPTMMNDARVSAEEMIAIMANAEKMGIYDDKGIDAIKEGMLRVREGTKSAQDAMRALGIDVDDTYKKIKEGSLTYFDVIKLISAKIKETGADSRITGTAIADLFGGPGEDAGYRYISQLATINKDLNSLTANVDSSVVAKNKEVEANEKLNNVWIKLTGTASFLSKAYTSAKSGMADMLSYVFRIKEAKISDEFLQQESRLRYLKSQLDITNISEAKKLEIFQALKTEFPQYFKGLDLEKMKHDEITKAINKSIDALGRKYKAQVFQEKFDETALDYQDKLSKALDYEKKGRELIGEAFKKYPELSNLKFKSSTTVNQLRELDTELQKIFAEKRGDGTIFDSKSWESLDTSIQRSIHATSIALANANKAAVKSDQKRIEDQRALAEMQSKLIPDTFSTVDPETPGSNKDGDLTGAKEKAAKDAEAARKKAESERKKALEEQRRDLEESIRAEAEANNRSIEQEIQFQVDKANIQNDSREKELRLQDLNFIKELNDQRKQQEEILKNIADLEKKRDEAKSPEAKSNYDAALLNQRKLLETHGQIVQITTDTHRKKVATINEKWDGNDFQKAVEAEQRLIELQRQKDEEDIINIDSLSQAKSLLKNNEYLKLTDQELSGIKTLEDAKSALREAADRKMLSAQLVSLETQKKQLEDLIISLSDGPAKEALLKNLDELSQKITQVKGVIKGGNEQDEKKVTEDRSEELSQIDILGFSAEQWSETFNNLDSMKGKLQAAAMVFQALGNAVGMYSKLQQALGQKELKKFEEIQEGKKKHLLTQLREGWLSQEQYNKEVQKLDVQTANKKAEIEYKQAKAEKLANIFSILGSTAAGIAAALPNIPLSIIVGVLGAAQLAMVAAQPLPEKPSFAKGGFFEGFTGDSSLPPDETGERPIGNVKLHQKEWVAPRWMTENPKTANVIGYLESVRTGKTKPMAEGGFADSNTTAPVASNFTNSQDNSELARVLAELRDVLNKIKNEGIMAYILKSARVGKDLQEMIDDYNNLKNKNKH